MDIQRWDLKKANEIKLDDFHASHGWLENFENRHRLTSLKITNFVSRHQIENPEDIEKSKQNYILEFNKVSFHFKPSEICNTDQTGVEERITLQSYYLFRWRKKDYCSCSVEKCYYTLLHFTTTIPLDGRLLETIYLCLQEQ